MYTEEQITEWKEKAAKWDDLSDQIAACYGKEDEDGDWEENDDPNTDLCTIGEIAATAFGWL